MRRIFVIGLLLSAGLGLRAVAAQAATCSPAGIQAIAPTTTTIDTAVEITTGAVPYCEITAHIVTNAALNDIIHYDLDLPDPSFWNARFLFSGNGEFGGVIGDITKNIPMGYAEAATDTGHTSTVVTDSTWALDNLPAIQDFEYRSVHETASASEQILTSYYGNLPYFSYFQGCSTAGRQGLVEAQDYPNDFDGIVAGDPAIGQPYLGFNWTQQAILAGNTAFIDTNAIDTLNSAVLSQCDGVDGVVDGLIQDPTKCAFNPASIQCAAGQTKGCLGAGQVAALNKIYQGPVDTTGKSLYPGLTVSDPESSATLDAGWETYIIGCNTQTCLVPSFTAAEPYSAFKKAPVEWTSQDGFFKDFIFNSASFDTRTISYKQQNQLNRISNTTAQQGGEGQNPNIAQFASLGHKLLMYHGWSDPAFSPLVSVNYFNSVEGVLGTDGATTNTLRLFMVPDMHHCQSSGPGPNDFDALSAVETWVEQDIAPDGIIASHHEMDDFSMPVDRTMPLCSYPEEAVYNGVGGLDSATSWSCPSSS